jgi:hypothetical protein
MTNRHPFEMLFTDDPVKTVLMDSISYVSADNRGDIIISGSHGGTSSAGYAIDAQVAAAFFNDAGGGKNNAGIKGFAVLDEHGIIACAVSHESAEIANGRDTYKNGVITQVNKTAAQMGIAPGGTVRDAVELLRLRLKKL